jgi:hypothetical protein
MVYTYIGWLDDPNFKFEGGDWSGNIPRRRFPREGTARWGGFESFNKVASRIERHVYVGDQTDWGAFVAKVSKQQLKDFVAELFDDGPDKPLPKHLADDLREANDFIEALDPNKEYALVACEDDDTDPIPRGLFDYPWDLAEFDRMLAREKQKRLASEKSPSDPDAR